jgi:hypothetical protein
MPDEISDVPFTLGLAGPVGAIRVGLKDDSRRTVAGLLGLRTMKRHDISKRNDKL